MQNFDFSYHLLLLSAWLAYVILHSLLASPAFKTMMQGIMGSRFNYYRLAYSFFAMITLILILIYQFSVPSPLLFESTVFIQTAGVILAVLGVTGMAICIRKYFLNLSGVDVLLKEKREPILEIKGLHRAVRHPLYSSTLLFCWALFLLLPNTDNLLACLVVTIYTLIGIRLEEKKLVAEFGQNYSHYAKATPMLIPDLAGLILGRKR